MDGWMDEGMNYEDRHIRPYEARRALTDVMSCWALVMAFEHRARLRNPELNDLELSGTGFC